ncbi:hypothetical protein [Dyadobacter sp. CY323]|uniref:hypothetical protein n=1 Tax=Dyadobacter sp. CY323 TaxID=2907302 RepID=UPI001F324444|nr:hypothetical protein [Dyadobacter sp. CY323]MCE6992523.1 hypothetical protein [Dyadobacter sp. CY323]
MRSSKNGWRNMAFEANYHRIACLWLMILTVVSTFSNSFAQNLQGFRGQKPFEINGSLSASLQFYTVDGIASRRQPFTWFLTGSPVMKLYGMTFPFSFTVSEQERRFSQPFNQYGVSPSYKWIKLHLGYRNVRFSDYTLAGANFLGAGIELNPGKFRAGFVYGRFARAVQEDSSSTDPRYRYLRPSYKRIGMAGKLGYGGKKAFIDVSAFGARDVIGSIPTPSLRSRITPMENLAIGIKNHIGFLKQKLTFDLDLGASLLTRDISGYDLEDPLPWQNTLLSVMAVNNSTSFFTAASASAAYSFAKIGSLRLGYQRIDPDYQSLGAYYFQNDVEQFTVSPSFSLLKNKLNVNGSYGRSHDNLNGKKLATTHRNVGSLNVNAALIPKLSINLGYTNFGVGQSRGLGDLFNDSLAVSLVNASYSGNLSYLFGTRIQRQTVGLMVNYQNTNDQNRFTRQYTGASSFVSALNYSHSHTAAHLNGNLSLSYVTIDTYGRKMVNIGPGLSVSKEWPKQKIRTSFTHNSQFRTTNGLRDGRVSNTGISASMSRKKQSFSMSVNNLHNRYQSGGDAVSYRNFAEYRGTISYGVRF